MTRSRNAISSWLASSKMVALAMAVHLMHGCAVGPDYAPPEMALPDAWHQELGEGLLEGEANLEVWWTLLADPVLNKLIDQALDSNLDLQGAFARVMEARALYGIASGQYFPDIDAASTYQRGRISEEIAPELGPGTKRTDDFFGAGFDVSWELDVFGRIQRSVESADASFIASIEAFRDVQVILFAEVARNYVDIRTLQARIAVAEANVESQRGTLQLTRDRFDAQLVPELDVRQAELNLATTESFIPSLRILLGQSMHRLGVLLGGHPELLYEELSAEGTIPDPPAQVVVGLPTELLRQRPDIRAAERGLAAQVALVGVATADLYPRFSLVGTFALEATDFGNMWDQAARAYSFGPSMRWNIFDGGRVRSNIRAEDARAAQALIVYEQVVLSALEEVENSLIGFTQESLRRDVLGRSVEAASQSVELVRTLYRTGLTNFQNVLDTERSLFQQQDAMVASRGDVIQNLINLYKALGGGWRPAEEEETEESDVEES